MLTKKMKKDRGAMKGFCEVVTNWILGEESAIDWISWPGEARHTFGKTLPASCGNHDHIFYSYQQFYSYFSYFLLFSLQFQHPSSLIFNTGPLGGWSMQYKTENDRISVQKQIIWASWGLCIRVIRFLWYWKPIFFFVLCEIYALRVVHSSWR